MTLLSKKSISLTEAPYPTQEYILSQEEEEAKKRVPKTDVEQKFASILESLWDCHTWIRKYIKSMSRGEGRDREKILEIQEEFSRLANEPDRQALEEDIQIVTEQFNTVYEKALKLSELTIEERLDLRVEKLKEMKKSLDEYGCPFAPEILQSVMKFSPKDLGDLKAAEDRPHLEYTKLRQQCIDLNEFYVSTKSLNDSLKSQGV